MSSEQEFKCVFCSETFSQKEDLQVHFRKHGDPNFNQHKIKARNQDETNVLAEKPKDQVEVVECDVCTEVFSTISKAITHKHKVHPDHDTKYFCPWCGKLFTMKHLYNKHIQASHLEMERRDVTLFHCDSCNVDFNIPAAMVYHNKFYHRQEELPTLGHSKKLRMILEEVIQIYYCPFCGEEYDNKVNLHKHMTDEHSGENQSPDDVFRCPLCDAIFYYLDAYELHLTHHSIEDLYTERNEMMDEITDFSLESVQPLQEKVEPLNEEKTPIGIEELLEFTMEDSDQRKSKKHKKHKKSKKNAITLDEFLNMNKDVFGEGIDFQGIEEVPTQVVAKRLKPKKVAASKFMSSDLAKLKRQGIVVKKQPTKIGKPIGKQEINKNALKTVIKVQKNINLMPQTKSNTLTSTDAVLSKLLNQGSQIKVVKKSNQEHEEHIQENENNIGKETLSHNNMQTENKDNNIKSDATEEKCIEDREKNIDIASPKINNDIPMSQAALTDPAGPSVIGNNKEVNNELDELGGHSPKLNNNLKDYLDEAEACSNEAYTDNFNMLRNNSNIAIKLCKQNASRDHTDNISAKLENDDVGTQDKEPDSHENTEKNTTSFSEKPMNALKHLSHVITIKSVNSSKTGKLSDDSMSENSSHKPDMNKALNISQSNSPKRPESTNYPNLKNLSGITIKPTTQISLNTLKNNQSVEKKYREDHDTDDERNENKSQNNKTNSDKVAQSLKSPQMNSQTKCLQKTIQKESLLETPNNESNPSSTDLLKHLKNVTAKPVHANPQKISTPQSSPSTTKRTNITKTYVQKEITEDGTEIFSIDDSDSDETNCNKSTKNTIAKTESRIEQNKLINSVKNKSNIQQCKTINTEKHSNKTAIDKDDDWDDDFDNNDAIANSPNTNFSSPQPNQKNIAINNVLKNLSKNITVKSRNSSPSLPVLPQKNVSKDPHLEANDEDSDPDSPLNRVKITEMDNMSDDELEDHTDTNILHGNVKVEHPDESLSEHDDGPINEESDDMSDIESQITAAKVQKDHSSMKNIRKDLTSPSHRTLDNNKQRNSIPEEIPNCAKNLSNQIAIRQIKKPENKQTKVVEQNEARATNQSSVNQKMASSSNQVNTFNKEVKTVKTYQTQTNTVIEEITTTVTKTIKTVNQTMQQEVRKIAQSSTPSQKNQGINTNFLQKSFQGVKVRQSVPNVRPKIRGQAPQTIRPAICAPPKNIRPAICPPVRASNQLVPFRPAVNRPSTPKPRMPNVMNPRASTSGQHRPQIGRPVKISPGAVFSSLKKPAETSGHFSCFKKPKESLIPVMDFPAINKNDGESSAQFSSSMQMSKSNFSSSTTVLKGNTVVTSTQMKSEMSASSQQLSKLRGMSGLSVVKTSQNQAKQSQVEEKSEMSASKRNTLETIQMLQNQGLLIKKPRLEDDVGEGSDHSHPGSDDMQHDSNEDFDE